MKRFLPVLAVFLLLVPIVPILAYGYTCISPSGVETCPTDTLPGYCNEDSRGVSGYGPCSELLDNGQCCAYRTCCIVIIVAHWSYFIAAGIALLVIIWAGIMYMTAAGDENKVGKAKKTLLYGLIGALIVWGSGYILATIIEFLM